MRVEIYFISAPIKTQPLKIGLVVGVALVGFIWLIAAHNDAIEKSGNKYPDAARHANSLSRNDTSLRVWINSKA